MGKGKGKKNRNKEGNWDESPDDAPSNGTDLAVLASVLSSEFPLLDSSLVHALISDYDPATIHTQLDEIRGQLGILEATSVPDSEEASRVAAPQLYADSDSFPSLASSSTAPVTVASDDEQPSPRDEEELLAVFFPKLRAKDIKEALAAEPNLDAAIDHLLSVELIRGVQRTGAWPDEPPGDEDKGGWVKPVRRGSSNRSTSGSPGSTHSDLPSHGSSPDKQVVLPGLRGIGTTYTTERDASTTHLAPPVSQPHGNGRYTIGGAVAPTGKGKKSKKRPALTIPLGDMMQRRASPLPTPSPSGSASSRSSRRPASDVWAAFSSLAAFLAETVPRAPASYFLSYLHSGDYYSAHEAVSAALGALAATATDSDPPEEAVAMLEAMYDTAVDDDQASQSLHTCLRVTEGDVAAVMDLMDMLIELTWWPDYEAAKESERDPFSLLSELQKSLPGSRPSSRLASSALSQASSPASSRPSTPAPSAAAQTRVVNSNRLTRPAPPPTAAEKEAKVKEKGVPGSRPSATPYTAVYDHLPTSARWEVHSAPNKAKSKGHQLNWRTVAPGAKKRTARSAHPLAASIPAYARGELPNHSSLSPSDCYARGELEWQKRVDAIRTAAQHFGSGGRKDIAAMKAGYYAAEARRATSAAKEWELEGARMVVDAQLEKSHNSVDLHYATVDQAVVLALETAERWWSRPGSGGRLTVVTGKGVHSANRRGVLGPAVARALTEKGWRVERHEGYITVLGK